MRPAKLLWLILVLFIWVHPLQGACSGSGTTWSCTAGSSDENVQSAIDSASDGARVTFAIGSYTWDEPVSLNNIDGIVLICATEGGCDLNFTDHDVITRDLITSDVNALTRISGFDFSGTVSSAAIWLYGNANIRNLRIDHNTFSLGASQIAILLGETSTTGRVDGVVDNNRAFGADNFMLVKNISGGFVWTVGLRGTGNNLFIEDNECDFDDNSDLGTGCIDVWRANGTVVRYNTLNNSRIVNHSLCHDGPINSEVYRNTINSPMGDPVQYRGIHFQGSGEIIAWDNVLGGASGGHMALQHFRSDASVLSDDPMMTEGGCLLAQKCDGDQTGVGTLDDPNDGNRTGEDGYPCWHQPGRDNDAALRPIYLFLNRNASGARVDVSIESGGLIDSHLIEDRDYYNAVSASAQSSTSSPFNGTTGVGHGTLALRPTTCTTEDTVADQGNGGVAYWATDQGSWNSQGTDGVLYVCRATNTWILYYTPYQYPHPLRLPGGPVNIRVQPRI